MGFVLVGQVNVLAPVVTISFMLTYIAVDYSYFALSMAHSGLPQSPRPVPKGPDALRLLQVRAPSYGSDTSGNLSDGTLLEFTKDMDQLLQPLGELESSRLGSREGDRTPKRQRGKRKKDTKQTLQDSFLLDPRSDRSPAASCREQDSFQDQQTSRSESRDRPVPGLCTQPGVNGEGKCFGAS